MAEPAPLCRHRDRRIPLRRHVLIRQPEGHRLIPGHHIKMECLPRTSTHASNTFSTSITNSFPATSHHIVKYSLLYSKEYYLNASTCHRGLPRTIVSANYTLQALESGEETTKGKWARQFRAAQRHNLPENRHPVRALFLRQDETRTVKKMDEEKELHTQINRPRALNFKR